MEHDIVGLHLTQDRDHGFVDLGNNVSANLLSTFSTHRNDGDQWNLVARRVRSAFPFVGGLWFGHLHHGRGRA